MHDSFSAQTGAHQYGGGGGQDGFRVSGKMVGVGVRDKCKRLGFMRIQPQFAVWQLHAVLITHLDHESTMALKQPLIQRRPRDLQRARLSVASFR